jgi:DNA-directed RNA polymerase specialized sigma24 family protein
MDEHIPMAADPAVLAMARRAVNALASRFPRLRDEFESAALFALVAAARTFDPDSRAGYPGHARRRVAGAMRDVLRDRAHMPRRRPLPPQLAAPAGADPDADLDVPDLLRGLSPFARDVVAAVHLDPRGGNLTRAAALLGVPRSRVVASYRRSMAKMRQRLDGWMS